MKTPVLVLMSLASTLLCGTASADNRTYLSASCQEDGAGESGSFKRNEAEITRVSGVGSGRLICPVIRGNTASPLPWAGGAKASARVSVTDWNPNGDVKCALSVRNHNGSPVGWLTKTTDGMKSTQQFLEIGPINSGSDLPVSIECVMPVNAGGYYTSIHSYRADS